MAAQGPAGLPGGVAPCTMPSGSARASSRRRARPGAGARSACLRSMAWIQRRRAAALRLGGLACEGQQLERLALFSRQFDRLRLSSSTHASPTAPSSAALVQTRCGLGEIVESDVLGRSFNQVYRLGLQAGSALSQESAPSDTGRPERSLCCLPPKQSRQNSKVATRRKPRPSRP